MEVRNYSRSSVLVLLLLISCTSYQVKDKNWVKKSLNNNQIRKLDSFMKKYLHVDNVDTFLNESISEIDTNYFINKRFVSKELTYYYGRLIPDGYYQDHLNNIISRDRNELWGMLFAFEGYEVFELDSIQVFHEVKLDNILVGYYLNNSKPNKFVEKTFKRFLKKEFNYVSECKFPSRIYE